ncbi:EAL domain-containing protein [Lacisediminimonas sp.]|uniref:EAL domain-containing response regulator n=1 Tax=Lacisediminimonas sp. TaxID=3060582 RepID=UPI002722AEC9|nr:EAL domain-containing response regulator [Lacisediminimonas sp.]MDO8298462.1 EAL domain-containing response regulator [Lacisediminimonas sp.]
MTYAMYSWALVLDDDPFVQKTLSRMLLKLDVRDVVTCGNAELALATIIDSGNSPDLVLFDLNMPEMDGIEFVRGLVERQYSGGLIIISGEDERVLNAAAILAREHRLTLLGQLVKPVSSSTLRKLLEKWVPKSVEEHQPISRIYSPQELQQAIQTGELVNFYQPIVAVSSGQCVGVETLVRWRHPRDGLVMPNNFIGVAEEHGLIDELTHAVLRGVFTQIAEWERSLIHLRVAINVSMINLVSLSFPDIVAHLAKDAGVAPRRIKLEVTETQLLEDLRAPLDVLVRLRLKGFRLSIDDFGTGHSSLAQLRDIPFDQIKIDRGFVHRAWADNTVRAIYDASLNLSRQLGFEAVAEGVEDRADWDFVRKTGCDLAQGYFISRPMPGEQLAQWLSAWESGVRQELMTSTKGA